MATAGTAPRAGTAAVAALLPYLALKASWMAGGRAGYAGDGPAGYVPGDVPGWLLPVQSRVDVTMLLALLGCALAAALTGARPPNRVVHRPPNQVVHRPPRRAPRRLARTTLAWLGATVAVGAVLAGTAGLTALLLSEAGLTPPDRAGYATWVGYLAYTCFLGYGLALGRAARDWHAAGGGR